MNCDVTPGTCNITKMNVPSKTTNLKMLPDTIRTPTKTIETIQLAPTAVYYMPKLGI